MIFSYITNNLFISLNIDEESNLMPQDKYLIENITKIPYMDMIKNHD